MDPGTRSPGFLFAAPVLYTIPGQKQHTRPPRARRAYYIIITARLLYRAIILYSPRKLQNELHGLFVFYSYIIIHKIIARYTALYDVMRLHPIFYHFCYYL